MQQRRQSVDDQHVAGLQDAGLEAPGPGLDLAGDQLAVGGLEMRNVYLGIDTQPGQLFGKLDGVQMLGGDGQVPLAVGKGRFQDEMTQVRNAIDGAPEFLGGQRVARIDEAAGRAPM